MASGNDLIARVVDLVPEMGDNTGTLSAAEEARLLRNMNAELEKIEASLASIGQDYQLTDATFTITSSQPNNRYDFITDVGVSDLKDVRMVERVVDASANAFIRIWPVPDLPNYRVSNFGDVVYDTTVLVGMGRPTGYLLGNNWIQFVPYADQNYDIRIWYTQRYGPIAASTDALTFPPELNDVLVYASAAREKELRREFQDSQMFFTKSELFKATALADLATRRDDPPHIITYLEEGEYI